MERDWKQENLREIEQNLWKIYPSLKISDCFSGNHFLSKNVWGAVSKLEDGGSRGDLVNTG